MRRNNRKRTKKNINLTKLQKTFIILFIIILLIILFFFAINYFMNKSFVLLNDNITETNQINNESNNIEIEENSVKQDSSITFNMTAIGDSLCHNTQYWDAYNNQTKEYDFSYVYDDIKYYTKTADITIGSLETTFAGEDRGYSNYPTFNSPDSLATALKKIGVDIISLAGNHALDYGYTGLCRTIDVLDNADISHLGTYKTAEDQEKLLIKNVKGLNIAFINYTYGTNGIPVPSGKEFCINLIDKNSNMDFIREITGLSPQYLTKLKKEKENLHSKKNSTIK